MVLIVCVCVCVFLCVCVSTLVVRRGRPEEVVADLVRSLPFVSAVVFHQEVGST